MKVFEELLLDADWSVNAGTWMWLSCSSFFQQFFHCYCPVKFGRKADPNGDYIRRYLPILKVNSLIKCRFLFAICLNNSRTFQRLIFTNRGMHQRMYSAHLNV